MICSPLVQPHRDGMINKASQLLYIGFTTGQNNRGRRHLISVGGEGGREGERSLACPSPLFVEGVWLHATRACLRCATFVHVSKIQVKSMRLSCCSYILVPGSLIQLCKISWPGECYLTAAVSICVWYLIKRWPCHSFNYGRWWGLCPNALNFVGANALTVPQFCCLCRRSLCLCCLHL